MEKYLLENISGDDLKDKYMLVSGVDLQEGVYKLDEDYVEVGKVVKETIYEEGLKVEYLDTGERYVEIQLTGSTDGSKVYLKINGLETE